MPQPTTDLFVAQRINDLPNAVWYHKAKGLTTRLQFKDFTSAIAFMADLAPAIDALVHHPEWTNVYNRIDIVLCTHDAGNRVTQKDLELAALIDERFGATLAKTD